jgi:hypothetical protein
VPTPDGAAPSITVTADGVITGRGFLPSIQVTVRVIYTAEGISDYLSYLASPTGELSGRLPTAPTTGALNISGTDHRSDPDGVCGRLWSRTQTLEPHKR